MLMLEVGVNWNHIQKTFFLKKGIYFPDNPLVEIWPKWHWIRSNVHIKCFSRISPFWLIHRYWHTLRTSSPCGQRPYMIAPSKCQDALNQVMISSSVKIHHVQPTTEICHLVTWGWSKTLRQTQPTTFSLSTSLQLPQQTSSSRSSH